ncbi:DUF4397 domain-containing protein [Pedobacter sp. GSP4]|uniref:DUF4397 domain-containing protein n=1 Tax=Pedobacter sp. GSP4 TaxID=3453716 RepID=UPI003EEE0646
MKKTFNLLKSLTGVCLLATILLSCKKEESGTEQPAPTTAAISFNNGIAGLGKLDFYINGTKQASLDGNLHSGYSELKPGSIEVKATGSISISAAAQTGSATFTAIAGKNYSVYACGAADAPQIVYSEDNLNAPAAGSGKIRFINLYAGSKGLDLNVRGKQPVFSNLLYKNSTNFENMAAASEVSFELRENGSEQVIFSLEKVKIETDKIYTIIATANSTEINSAAKLVIITNK